MRHLLLVSSVLLFAARAEAGDPAPAGAKPPEAPQAAKPPEPAATSRQLFTPTKMTARLTLYVGGTIEKVPGVKRVQIADERLGTATLLPDDEVEFRLTKPGETQIVYELRDGTRYEYVLLIDRQ